ncbi:MAG: tripartite tricarboxylate transporter substrate binding protein [Betaproteobacteria bacterium]|nr:tripartite tricarboxylate transporter substrate binding protein [Betaproteobacteria bacterium]
MRNKWLVACLAGVLGGSALAQTPGPSFPTRPITVVVPFAPGGIADITARPLAPPMAKALGQNVVIENRAGAGGAIGHAYLARARPDGYTLMMALSSVVIIPESEKVSGRQPSYTMSQFAPIALVSADPTVLLVRADAPWKTVRELIEDARRNPGKISYSTSGLYGTTHTAQEMLWQAAGVKLLHVPYNGGGPSMTALLASQVDITAQAPGVASPHVKGGKVRMLGGWGAQRIKAMPDLPTMKEQGFEVEFYIWSGLFAPAGTPPEVLAKLRAAVRESVQDSGFRTAMAGMDTPINHLDGADFEAFLDIDAKRLAEVVKRMGKLE